MTAVVFDCNVFLQALTRPDGPAGRCFTLTTSGVVDLVVAPALLDELRDVFSRPKLMRKLHFTAQDAIDFLAVIQSKATVVNDVPVYWILPRDASDSLYINLAIAAGASLVVSRDLDLLDLMNEGDIDGQTLRTIAPDLRIVTPPQMIQMVDAPDTK